MENIIKIGDSTIIMNGGDPLPGCPEDWDEAKKILARLNDGKEEFHEPQWSFDCGFKLDFDGPILDILSRFYPPKSHYGNSWDGTVTIYLLGKEVLEKKFDCPSLEKLKEEVELFVNSFANKLNLL